MNTVRGEGYFTGSNPPTLVLPGAMPQVGDSFIVESVEGNLVRIGWATQNQSSPVSVVTGELIDGNQNNILVLSYQSGPQLEIVQVGGFVTLTQYNSGGAGIRFAYYDPQGQRLNARDLPGMDDTNVEKTEINRQGANLKTFVQTAVMPPGSRLQIETSVWGDLAGSWWAFIMKLK